MQTYERYLQLNGRPTGDLGASLCYHLFLTKLALPSSPRLSAPQVRSVSGLPLRHLDSHNSDLSIVVPFCNGLTFVVTALTARWLGERALNQRKL